MYRVLSGQEGAHTSLFPAAERQWQAVDVVLDCFLMEEGGHHGGFASSENMARPCWC